MYIWGGGGEMSYYVLKIRSDGNISINLLKVENCSKNKKKQKYFHMLLLYKILHKIFA